MRRWRRLTDRELELIESRNGFGLDLIDSFELLRDLNRQNERRIADLRDQVKDQDKIIRALQKKETP